MELEHMVLELERMEHNLALVGAHKLEQELAEFMINKQKLKLKIIVNSFIYFHYLRYGDRLGHYKGKFSFL